MKKLIAFLILFGLIGLVVLYFFFPGPLYELGMNLARRSAGLEEKSVRIDNHTIYYLEGGRGETIVLVHGFTAEKDNWTMFAKYITPSHQVVALDLPGFGESSRIPSESYTVPEQAKRLDHFVTALGLKKFHVAGNSMGGAIVAKYAVDYPEKVLSLGLFDSAGIWDCPEKSEFGKLLDKRENPLIVKNVKDYEFVIKFACVKSPPFPKRIIAYLAQKQIAVQDFNEKVWKDISDQAYDLGPDLGKIKAKTLILWGDTDRLLDVSCTQILQKGIADSQTVVMKDCGHIPMLERPKEAASHYLKFLSMSP
jgi:abhydrolase domain-containing protein 6